MIRINPQISFDEREVSFNFIRSPGPGGQNVNKVASAVLLRFNIQSSASLPESLRTRLLLLADKKINAEGELLIKASRHRSQAANKQDALHRLVELLKRAAFTPKARKKTKPSPASIQKRLTQKSLRSKTKSLRAHKPSAED